MKLGIELFITSNERNIKFIKGNDEDSSEKRI